MYQTLATITKKEKVTKQINTFKFLILIITFNSCFSSNEKGWAKLDITNLIKEKTDLIITEKFEVLEDSVEYTERAFDLGYTYSLKIKYDPKAEKYSWPNYKLKFIWYSSNN